MIKILEGFRVVCDPNKKLAHSGEVLLGLGNTQSASEGLVLQHKMSGKKYSSLSQYVYELEVDSDLTEYDTLCIEDFSVDTILSIWLFLNKKSQNLLPKNIDIWIKYASRWERGDTSTTGKPFESYGCLQNALVLFAKSVDAVTKLDKSLSFLDYLIKCNINPAHIPNNFKLALYDDAYKSLEQEYAYYETIVTQSKAKILYVPKSNSDKVKKVSAIFIETEIVSSIHKVFLRNDINSLTRDGYALMAVYNASAKGTGNDIVISVDPGKGIHMKALWQALEKEEDELWKGMRPNDSPRPLSGYPDNNGPNEPWWDDMGHYTLIAAPKMIDNEYGRRVSWETVKQLINKLYTKGIKHDRT